jgi:diguanylate cyclase (GGDEF)-like protein
LRADDFVARYGGEEFAVLLFVSNEAVIPRLIGEVLARFRAVEIPELGTAARLSCSAGYAVLRPSESPEALLGRADQALYLAKNEGRVRVVAAL